MLQVQGKGSEIVRSEWTQPMDLEEAARRLDNVRFTHVIAVHHETTAGRLNDLSRRDLEEFVEAISKIIK